MSTKGLDGLAGKIAFLQQGEYRHRHGAPVVGIPQVNGLILFQVFWIGDKLRSGIPFLVVFCMTDTLRVVVRVGNYRLNLK